VIATGQSAGSPVADRLLVLQFVRLFVAAAFLVVPVAAGAPTRDVVLLALAYLLFVGGVEIARRAMPGRADAIVSWTVRLPNMKPSWPSHCSVPVLHGPLYFSLKTASRWIYYAHWMKWMLKELVVRACPEADCALLLWADWIPEYNVLSAWDS